MRVLPIASLLLSLATPLACASTAPEGPGPMRPLEPDAELDAAPPIDISDEAAMHIWLAERVAAATSDQPERVRLPVVRRAEALGCDCPTYAIAATPADGPLYWLALVDLTSAGIPPGAWTGWVDGRFTGATRTYPSTDAGGSGVVTPVFEVLRQRRRDASESPAARSVRAVR